MCTVRLIAVYRNCAYVRTYVHKYVLYVYCYVLTEVFVHTYVDCVYCQVNHCVQNYCAYIYVMYILYV